MDFYDVISTRRSVRNYSLDEIPEDVIKRVLISAGKAPSGSNRQNWKYILIYDDKMKHELAAISSDQKFMYECPVLVVVCGKDMSSAYNRGGYMGELGMLVDGSITFTHFILAARAEGLGTCWVGFFDNERAKKLLDVPENWDVVAISPLGYPKKEGAFHSSVKRMDYDELVSAEAFTEPYNKDDFNKLK